MSNDRPDQLVIGGPERQRSRRGWVLGAGAAVLAVGGGAAAWAAVSFFGTGAQPAEVLPASTVGYVSVDLDPSGGQKIQALKLARKFPAFKEKVGLGTDDDLRRWLVEQVADDAGCDIDYGKDVEPWLGSRAAVAAVRVGQDEDPVPVLVLQTTDKGKAEDGLATLERCDAGAASGREHRWAFSGDWAVLADTAAQARAVVAAGEDHSLADDDHFRDWTSRVGDSGLLTAYAGPEAGAVVADGLASMVGDGSAMAGCDVTPEEYRSRVHQAMGGFDGAAATLRLSGGGLELDAVADADMQQAAASSALTGGAGVASGVTSLPADTAAAYAVGMAKDWSAVLKKQVATICGEGADLDAALPGLTSMLGVDPDELGSIVGDSLALAVGPGLDLEGLVNGSGTLPVAVRTTGDKGAVDRVLSSIAGAFGMPRGALTSRSGAQGVAVGPDEAYAQEVADRSGLGDDATLRELVPHADDASVVLFVALDRMRGAVDAMASGDRELTDNLAPVKGLGLSSWTEKKELHATLRIGVK